MTGPGRPADVIVFVPFCFSNASIRFCNASTVGVAGLSVAAAGSTPSSARSVTTQAVRRHRVVSSRVMCRE